MSSDIHVDFLRKSHGKKQKCTERERFQSYLIISLHRIALFCQENHIHSPKHFSTTNCKNNRTHRPRKREIKILVFINIGENIVTYLMHEHETEAVSGVACGARGDVLHFVVLDLQGVLVAVVVALGLADQQHLVKDEHIARLLVRGVVRLCYGWTSFTICRIYCICNRTEKLIFCTISG